MALEFATVASAHAKQRCQQRGIASQAVDLVLKNFDTVLHAGDGCQSVRVSRKALKELRDTCADRQMLERISKIVVVMREDSMKVVTVLQDYGISRCYRRQDITSKWRM